MLLNNWLAFATASAVLVATPGPIVLLVISDALRHDRKPAAIVAGVAVGSLTAMTTSILGFGAALAALATIFTVLCWSRGAYLAYLGLKLWRLSDLRSAVATTPAPGSIRLFAQAFAVTIFNPRSIIFFMASVPQFVTASDPVWPQVILLEATFIGLATLSAVVFAILASVAGAFWRPVPRLARTK